MKDAGLFQRILSFEPFCISKGRWIAMIGAAHDPAWYSEQGRRTVLLNRSAGSPLRLAKSDAFTATVICDEYNAGSFHGLAKGGLVSQSNRDFPINDFCSSDRGYADF
jgi:hypothetical protein